MLSNFTGFQPSKRPFLINLPLRGTTTATSDVDAMLNMHGIGT